MNLIFIGGEPAARVYVGSLLRYAHTSVGVGPLIVYGDTVLTPEVVLTSDTIVRIED